MARRGGETERVVEIGERIRIRIMEKWKEEEKVWTAGEVLGRYVVMDGVISPGSVCVELGAGTGVVSLAVAALRRDQGCEDGVIATDAAHGSLKNIRKNATLNGLSVGGGKANMEISTFHWGSPLPEEWSSRVDLILGSDIVFSPHTLPSAAYFSLSRAIAELLSPASPCGARYLSSRGTEYISGRGEGGGVSGRSGREALICLQVRGDVYEETATASFVTDLRRRKLEVEFLPIPAAALGDAPDEIIEKLVLLRIRPSGDAAEAAAIDFAPLSGTAAGENYGFHEPDAEVLEWAMQAGEE